MHGPESEQAHVGRVRHAVSEVGCDKMTDTGETSRADPAVTRRRLVSLLAGEPYRPELLAKIARTCVALNESAQAGSYWLLSDAHGIEVDAAVEAFVESCQRTPRLMASQLPRFKRDWDIDSYAPAAKSRIA